VERAVKFPHRRQFLRLAAGAATLPALPHIARAQAYPTRPINLIVPFAAGGGADTVLRIIVEPMRSFLGQTIIIENVSGASGNIGTGRVYRAPPDGYTLGAGNWGTHVANGAIYALPYDVLLDFQPVALHQIFYYILAVRKALPADNLRELIAWLKANPDKASLGTPGVGQQAHLASILFQKLTGTNFQHVPYRGSGPAVQDLIAGQIDFVFGDPGVVPAVRAGSVKAIAVAAKRRLPSVPDVPTAEESGLPGFAFANWVGIFAPKDTPKGIVGKLNGAVMSTLAEPSIRARLIDLGVEIPSREQQTPDGFAALQKADIEQWWPIIKAAGIKPE
jgi:tripartite-type tricarboxylate transporter receptor subunit TctC